MNGLKFGLMVFEGKGFVVYLGGSNFRTISNGWLGKSCFEI